MIIDDSTLFYHEGPVSFEPFDYLYLTMVVMMIVMMIKVVVAVVIMMIIMTMMMMMMMIRQYDVVNYNIM
jgi:hypothetical protein